MERRRLALFLLGFIFYGFTSFAYAELKLPGGNDRRPNLSMDPFERAREALRKLPTQEEPEKTVEPEREQQPRVAPPVDSQEEVPPPPGDLSSLASEEEPAQAFSYEFDIIVDALSVVAGGLPPEMIEEDALEQNTTGVFGVVDLIGDIDTGAMGLWDNGLFHAHAILTFGAGPAVGDYHGTSGIYAGANLMRFYELYYEHSFPQSNSAINFGWQDFNSDFYVSEYANLFVGASIGMGQAVGEVLPSTFPVTTLSTRFKSQLSDLVYFQAAIFDANPDADPDSPAQDKILEVKLPTNQEVFAATEFGILKNEPGDANGYLKIGIGLWYLNASQPGFEDANGNPILADNPLPGNSGGYILAETSIGENLGLFFKHGRSRSTINQYSQFYAAGLNYSGLIPGREEDVFGMGFVHTRQSQLFMDEFTDSNGNSDFFIAETAIEITYLTQIADWLSVQPTFQYIQQPSMDVNIPNAIVVGVRAAASF